MIRIQAVGLVRTYDNAKPGLHTYKDNKKVLVHLGNIDHFLNGDATPENTWAIHLDGSAYAQVDDIRDFEQWGFDFIQLLAEPVCTFRYAGLSSGQITLSFSNPPAFDGDYRLDSSGDQSQRPFAYIHKYTYGPLGPNSVWIISQFMNDHPIEQFPMGFWNYATNEMNFLYQVDKHISVLSAFVAHSDARAQLLGQKFTCLAHVTWEAVWSASIRYTDLGSHPGVPGVPRVSMTTSTFNVGKPMLGEPTNQKLKAMITNPMRIDPKDMYFPAKKRAHDKVIEMTSNNNNIKATKEWPSDLPANFISRP
jgi:hypothetical protein